MSAPAWRAAFARALAGALAGALGVGAGCGGDGPAPATGGPATAGAHAGHDAHGATAAAGAGSGPAPSTGAEHAGHGVPGYATVAVEPATRATLGIRTTTLAAGPLRKTIRTVGLVTADETRTSHVHVKYAGFIEKVWVDYVGRDVKAGEKLFSIYSPDVLAAEQEYLVARASLAKVPPGAAGDSSRAATAALVLAARRRLELFDVPAALLAEIERTGVPARAVTLTAPRAGTVLERGALPGMAVDPMAHLYVIADLSRVWVQVDAYERDLPIVRVGATATLALAALPGKTFSGAVTFISPRLDEATRTAKVRLELDNPERLLKPGMYATAELAADLGVGLSVPSDAVIDTGTRRVVFVARADGAFEPRAVTLGVPLDDAFQVLDGLAAGEAVVVAGQFVLDSESRLRGAAAAGAAPVHGGH